MLLVLCLGLGWLCLGLGHWVRLTIVLVQNALNATVVRITDRIGAEEAHSVRVSWMTFATHIIIISCDRHESLVVTI